MFAVLQMCSYVFLLLSCLLFVSSVSSVRVGGVGSPKTPSSQDDADVKIIAADIIRQAFINQTGITPNDFYVISYATQVVAGTIYYAKVRIDTDTYAHLRIIKPLPYTNKPQELRSVQTGKTLDDPIDYFSESSIASQNRPETSSTTFVRPVFSRGRAGGVGMPKVPSSQDDPDVKIIAADIIRQAFINQTGITPNEFYVISYATQVVAGTNFFAKVRIDTDTYVHLRIFKPLPYTNKPQELHGIQTGKPLDDPIDYFSGFVSHSRRETTTATTTTTTFGSDF